MTNRRHHPRHHSVVPFWPDVIAIEDDHGDVCRLCRHIFSPRPLVLLSRQLRRICLASVPVSSCPALSSSHRTGWLLRVVLSSRLVVACCLVTLAGCCMSRHLCHCILLRRHLVLLLLVLPLLSFLSLLRLVGTCCIVALCLALPSHRLAASLVWFLLMPPVYLTTIARQ